MQIPRRRLGSLYDLKPEFQRLLQPLARRLAAAGARPNQVTAVALALSLLAGAFLAARADVQHAWLVLAPVLAMRMALNALDGMLAVRLGRATPAGMLFNEVADTLSDVALYLPLTLVPGVRAPLVAAVVALALLTELAGVAAAAAGVGRRYDGPLGKCDRALAFAVIGLLLGIGYTPGRWLTAMLLALLALLVWTLLRRCRWALPARHTAS